MIPQSRGVQRMFALLSNRKVRSCLSTRIPFQRVGGLRTKFFLRKALVFVFLAGVAFGAAGSQAQTFNEAQNQTFYFDLDSNEGSSSKWSHLDVGSISGLRATVEAHRLGKGMRWVDRWGRYIVFCDLVDGCKRLGPIFAFCVDTKDGCFGLSFESPRGKPPLVFYAIVKGEKAEPIGQTIGVGEKINIDLDWSVSGKLALRVGSGRPHELSVPGPITSLTITAFSGELIVHSIRLGTFTY
jgi:hypothetical protein